MKRLHKWSITSILALILAWFGYQAYAVDANISGTLPTTYTDNTPIPAGDLASFNIYRKKDNGTYSLLTTKPISAGDTTLSFLDSNLANGVYCYKATVVRLNGIESAQSNEACKTVDTRVPNAIVNLQVQ